MYTVASYDSVSFRTFLKLLLGLAIGLLCRFNSNVIRNTKWFFFNFRYKNEDYADSYLKGKNLFGDQIRLRGSIPVDEVFTREAKQAQTGRNFAWSDNDETKS